jgi:hypothetical protein
MTLSPNESPGRSRADIDLAAAISLAGPVVTPWQVERWRQAGLIEPAIRTYHGRGRGSTAVYPEGTVERGIEIAILIKPRRTLQDVALILFARGRPVRLAVLKAAYLEWLARIEKWLGSAETPAEKLDLAERKGLQLRRGALATRRGRQMRRRLRGRDESADSILLSALTNMLLVLQGAETTDDGIMELLEAGGLGAVTHDRAAGVGPIATSISADALALTRQFNLRTLREIVESAAEADLVMTRDVMRLVVPFAAAFSTVVRAQVGLPDAFGFGPLAEAGEDEVQIAYGAVVLLLMKDLIQSPEGQSVLGVMMERLPSFLKAADFVRSLPVSQAHHLGAASIGAPAAEGMHAKTPGHSPSLDEVRQPPQT